MEPIRKPVVNTQLEALYTLQRTTESFRYAALSIEHWLSPEGYIREWLRKNLHWSAMLVIPTLTVFPVVTLALWELEAWVGASHHDCQQTRLPAHPRAARCRQHYGGSPNLQGLQTLTLFIRVLGFIPFTSM